MKNLKNQRGFVVQGIIALIALIIIAGGAYYMGTRKVVTPKVNDNVVPVQNNSQPSITILSPNGGEVWKMGQTYNISYSVNGDLGPITISLNRYSDDGELIESKNIGVSNTNNFSYTVPVNTEITRFEANRYKIEVYPATGRELVTRSKDYFTITN